MGISLKFIPKEWSCALCLRSSKTIFQPIAGLTSEYIKKQKAVKN